MPNMLKPFPFNIIYTKKTGRALSQARPVAYNKSVNYRFGLISFHFEISGTMLSVTSSSRILQRCS